MHDDDKFDDFLRQAARDYKAPVAPPAEAIWSAIEADVAKAIAPRSQPSTWVRPAAWTVIGLAATLVIGISVGRWSVGEKAPASSPSAPTRAATTDVPTPDSHARAVTYEHLADAEVFLTNVRAELKSGRKDADRSEQSRDLLVRTRVLLGGAANGSPDVARLLEDLELLLAEIAALPPTRGALDKALLDESMRDGNIIPRIRATLPARSAGA